MKRYILNIDLMAISFNLWIVFDDFQLKTIFNTQSPLQPQTIYYSTLQSILSIYRAKNKCLKISLSDSEKRNVT